MKLSVENVRVILKKYLGENKEKMEHSIRVAKISVFLAKILGVSTEEAKIAALLHDIGKSKKRDEMLEYISIHNIEFYDFEYLDSEQDTDRFLELIRTKLQNENYKVYFTGAVFEFKNTRIKVQDNELMIAIKEQLTE